MIADLIDSQLKIRLITRNVMSVYSTNNEYTDIFLRKLKRSSYEVNGKLVSSDSFISYVNKNYNRYKNLFRFANDNKSINTDKFIEYLNFLGLHHFLWLHFCQLDNDDLSLVELLLQLSSDKPIVITDYIDTNKHKDKLYTLVFHVGLEDRLIITPHTDIVSAVNNATCQCYVKSPTAAKIQRRFPDKFINEEFNTDTKYYSGKYPTMYIKDKTIIKPTSYRYTLYELLLIFLFSLKMIYISVYNWRSYYVNRLYT